MKTSRIHLSTTKMHRGVYAALSETREPCGASPSYARWLGDLVARAQARAAQRAEYTRTVRATYCERGPWTRYDSPETYRAAVAALRRPGSYQLGILAGTESVSGSTLRGKAARYSGHYRASAESVLDQLAEAGLTAREIRSPKGARILVISQ